MTSKEDLINLVKDWLEVDDKLKVAQQEIKGYRDKKKVLTASLLSIMKNNEIDCLDMNSGKIVYCKQKTKAPLNKKTLLDNLEKYFVNNLDVDVSDVSEFILNNRIEKISENIKRK